MVAFCYAAPCQHICQVSYGLLCSAKQRPWEGASRNGSRDHGRSHRDATQQGLFALALNSQGIKSLLSLKSKHCVSKEINQSMVPQSCGTVCHANIEDPCLKVILSRFPWSPREENQKMGGGAGSSFVTAGQGSKPQTFVSWAKFS